MFLPKLCTHFQPVVFFTKAAAGRLWGVQHPQFKKNLPFGVSDFRLTPGFANSQSACFSIRFLRKLFFSDDKFIPLTLPLQNARKTWQLYSNSATPGYSSETPNGDFLQTASDVTPHQTARGCFRWNVFQAENANPRDRQNVQCFLPRSVETGCRVCAVFGLRLMRLFRKKTISGGNDEYPPGVLFEQICHAFLGFCRGSVHFWKRSIRKNS